jgi:hypothetical protein
MMQIIKLQKTNNDLPNKEQSNQVIQDFPNEYDPREGRYAH